MTGNGDKMRLKAAGLALALVGATVAGVPTVAAESGGPSGTYGPVSGEGTICNGQPATIIVQQSGLVTTGTDGDDVIIGTFGPDTIDAGAGNDTICGHSGDDTLSGGEGDDRLQGGSGNDDVQGGNGNDVIFGGTGDDTLRGEAGTDIVLGADGDDQLIGDASVDTLWPGNGNNEVIDAPDAVTPDDEAAQDDAGDEDAPADPPAPEEPPAEESTDFELTVLHVNDTHSHLDPDSGDLELPGGETRVEFGGFPSVVAKIDELAAEASGEVVKVHAGDAITGTLFFSLFEGEADAALLNEACFDVFALGNHEFDNSDQGFADFLGHLNGTDTCSTATLGSNVIPAPGTPLAPAGDKIFQDNLIIEYEGGERVGYVGIDIAGKTQNSSSPLDTTVFLDEIETAQSQIDLLTEAGVNKIVLVTHIGLANDLNLASQVSGVDVIVGGDSHTLLGDFADLGLNTGGEYPQRTTDADGNPVCVVQAWQFSWVVGELNVSFDDDGVVSGCEGTPHLILADSFQREPSEDADREELTGEARDEVVAFVEESDVLSIVTPDADADAVLDGFSAQVEVLEQQVIGTAASDLCLERIPGQGRSQLCDVADTAVNGGDIQQLVTNAFLARSFEADIAIQNSGGIRIDIPEGDVTIADVFELLPFANTIVNLEMTGEEIAAVVEEAIAFSIDPDGSSGAYPYGAGIRWDVDLTAADGERLSNIEVLVDGAYVPLDPAATFTVATNSFTAGGGDGYATFEAVADDGRVEDTLLEYAQIFIDYIEQDVAGVLETPAIETYSTQSIVALDG